MKILFDQIKWQENTQYIVFDDSKEFYDPQVSDALKVISNESMDLNHPKEFVGRQAYDCPKGISTESMDFDYPKVYSAVIHSSSMVLFRNDQ